MKKFVFLLIISFSFSTSIAQWIQRGSDIDGSPFQLKYSELSSDNSGNLFVHNSTNGNFVRVWEFIGTDWNLQATIAGSVGESFGWDVSMSDNGNRIVVGAPNRGALGEGGLDVFQNNGGTWSQLGNQISGGQGEFIGHSVSISGSGSTVVTGGTSYSAGGLAEVGIVKVYRFDGSDWNQIGQSFSGSNSDDEFGEDVAINSSGSIIAFSSDNYNDPLSDDPVGLVRVYELQGNSWVQLGDDIMSDIDEPIGTAVSLNASGNRVAIGGRTYGASGVVQVYQLVSGEWQLLGQSVEGEISQESFGNDVSLNGPGDIFVAGAPEASQGIGVGRTKVYRLDGITWNKIGGNIEGDPNFRGFGFGVTINEAGDKIVACSSTNEVNSEGIIKAYGNDNILNNEIFAVNDVQLYPNPVRDALTIDLPFQVNSLQIRIFDLLGSELITKEYTEVSSTKVEMNLPAGVYLLKLDSGATRFIKKITVK